MRAAVLLLTLTLSGCVFPWSDGDDEPWGGTGGSPIVTPPPVGPPLVFGGAVVDARDGSTILGATVRLDLAQVRPCERQGVLWTQWTLPVDGATFGPTQVDRPRSDDVAFFLHVSAEGYSNNVTYIGPRQAATEDLGNLTIALHLRGDVVGQAPEGTIVALDGPVFPRLAVADANGTYTFRSARTVPTTLLVAVDAPWRHTVAAPDEAPAPPTDARGWRLEGTIRLGSGASSPAEIVAYNATGLASAARASETGLFVLPLAAEPASLRIEARSPDGRLGGLKTLTLNGPPAVREPIILRPLC